MAQTSMRTAPVSTPVPPSLLVARDGNGHHASPLAQDVDNRQPGPLHKLPDQGSSENQPASNPAAQATFLIELWNRAITQLISASA